VRTSRSFDLNSASVITKSDPKSLHASHEAIKAARQRHYVGCGRVLLVVFGRMPVQRGTGT